MPSPSRRRGPMPRTSILAGAGAVAAAATTLGAAPGALAANAVFGGSTNDGEAIVVNADKTATKLKGAVVAWQSRCSDGTTLPFSSAVSVAKKSAGFSVGPDELTMTRNGKKRFSGVQTFALAGGDSAAAVVVKFAGRLSAKTATGTLSAEAKILDKSSGAVQGTCGTGSVHWKASRAPGRVYAGKTSQDQPFVARVDARRKRVTDVLMGWTAPCRPDGYMSIPEQLSNFTLASSGRFNDTWDQTVKMDDGGSRKFDYTLTGRLSRRSGAGKFRASVAGTDAGGASRESCDTGAVAWKVATG